MKVTDFTYLLKHPAKVVNPLQTKQLEDIIKEYPYFQAARALHLKGLKNLNSYKYNKTLKTTAAYTTDREVLFDFITSKDFLHSDTGEDFSAVEDPDLKQSLEPENHPKIEKKELIEPSEDKPLPQDTNDADRILDPQLFEHKENVVETTSDPEIGSPLHFDKKEKYSFSQWLALTSKEPVQRTDTAPIATPQKERKQVVKDSERQRKFDRIDRFIAENPKIVPNKDKIIAVDISQSEKLDKSELMTETLARVYLEQKKYKKAIQAYKILSLKYPEKSSFFADRIKSVEKIQQENS